MNLQLLNQFEGFKSLIQLFSQTQKIMFLFMFYFMFPIQQTLERLGPKRLAIQQKIIAQETLAG